MKNTLKLQIHRLSRLAFYNFKKVEEWDRETRRAQRTDRALRTGGAHNLTLYWGPRAQMGAHILNNGLLVSCLHLATD